MSKVLERLILTKYEDFFFSNPLQFGYKSGYSTTLCTGMIKNVVSRYIDKGSAVLGCFLDASKAFDMVDHGILFEILMKRGCLPLPIIWFLLCWYGQQQMQVCWGDCFSEPFCVSNGVRQGSVLSPVLFAVYLDGLLEELSASGVGCYWGCMFAGAFCYADDIVLLAPCPSALRTMLSICSSYAISHRLEFNANKTQLICFHTSPIRPYASPIFVNDVKLDSDKIIHLGHTLTHDLNDTEVIIHAIKDLNRKANTLCTFHSADPFVKWYLIKSYCLSLYGCVLWSLSTPSLKLIEIALNKILRKVWNLPCNSHTAIVHCVAQTHTVYNLLHKRFCSLALSSTSLLIKSVFTTSSNFVYSFTGYNFTYGHHHIKLYDDRDHSVAMSIRRIRSYYGLYSPCEALVRHLSC